MNASTLSAPMKGRFAKLQTGLKRFEAKATEFSQRMRLNSQRRSDFYELLGNFVADGLPLYDALSAIDEQYRKTKEPMAFLSTLALLRMRGGQGGKAYTFGQALHGYVPVVEAMAISSGEEAGSPAEGLHRAAQIARSNDQIAGTIREEVTYPFFLFMIFALVMIGIGNYVIPLFSEVLPQHQWPPVARYMAALAQATPTLLAVLGIFVVSVLTFYFLRRSHWIRGPRKFFDHYIFPWTLHRRMTGALLLSAMSTLIHIGVPFSQILERLAISSGPWEAMHLSRVRNRMRRGMREGDALATDLFDEAMRWQITLYGRMTNFSEGLTKLATRSIDGTQAAIRKSFGVLRVGLMVGIAALIAWVYTAFLSITMAAKSLS